MTALNTTATQATAAERLTAALIAAALGLTLIYTAGFANASTLHNAAHDWRHAHNFPCH
ncbi:MAG: CbtB domain-containing protein [Hyphomicrobiaceae bacterium]|jgi:cobalt transporter subunit CbtB|nr:CbtB domain-containing protein [Hyphomicrobiaceae bacterium]